MAYAVKESSRVQAWELGAGSVMEQEMIRCRKIVSRPGGIYEIFSREATGKTGQLAHSFSSISSWKETGIRKLPGG